MDSSQPGQRMAPQHDSAELLLRESDRPRLERIIRGLLDEQLSAVVVADDDGLLDHYGRMMASRLRESGAVKVEVYFPNSTDAVLARFNRILADLKVSEAIAPTGSRAEHRVLVVYDGRSTALKEIQLLGRLLKDFPGANTRLLMLLSRQAPETEQKVEALGKKCLRWDLVRPSADEARDLLAQAAASGMQPEAQALLDSVGVQGLEEAMALRAGLEALAKADDALGPLESRQQSAAAFAASLQKAAQAAEARRSEPPPITKPPVSAAAQPAAIVPSPAPSGSQPASPVTMPSDVTPPKGVAPVRRGRRSPLLVAGLVALAASAGMTGWQYLGSDITAFVQQQSAALLAGKVSKVTDAPPPAAEPQAAADLPGKSQEPGASPAASAPAETAAAVPAGPASAESPERAEPALPEATKESGAGNKLDPPRAAARPKTTGPQPLGPLPQRVSNEELVENRRKAPPPAAEPEAAGPGVLLEIKVLAPGFYVQHVSRETKAELMDYWRDHPALAKARVLKLKRLGAPGDNFVLLSGPFKSLEETKAFTKRTDLPADKWIRPASALRKLLPDN